MIQVLTEKQFGARILLDAGLATAPGVLSPSGSATVNHEWWHPLRKRLVCLL